MSNLEIIKLKINTIIINPYFKLLVNNFSFFIFNKFFLEKIDNNIKTNKFFLQFLIKKITNIKKLKLILLLLI